MFDNGTKYFYQSLLLTIIGKNGAGEVILQDMDGWQITVTKPFMEANLTLAPN